MPAATGRILCIDNRPSRNLAVFLLRRAGYEVVTAGSLTAALGSARGARFDLYLLNHKLLEGAGSAVCAKLDAAAPHTPILLYSTVTYPFHRRQAVRGGARGMRMQPVPVTEVAGAVARMLSVQAGRADGAPGQTAKVKSRRLSTRVKVLTGVGIGAAAILVRALVRGPRSEPRPQPA